MTIRSKILRKVVSTIAVLIRSYVNYVIDVNVNGTLWIWIEKMTGIDIESTWSTAAQEAGRDYLNLMASMERLPVHEAVDLWRQMATDLVFRLAGRHASDSEVEAALTSISACCQSCLFDFARPAETRGH